MRDALLRRSGVAEVQVNLQSNLVRIVPESSVAFDLRSIPFAVRDAGFRPGEMTIRARGMIEQDAGAPRFRITGWKQRIAASIPFDRAGDGIFARYHWERDPPILVAIDG